MNESVNQSINEQQHLESTDFCEGESGLDPESRSRLIYLPFPSQPKLILIYRPRRDGRLSWPGWSVTYRDMEGYSL